jgi:hypothetical protein
MRKLYLSITLLGMFVLMFAITMIPTQASSYQGITLDTPLSQFDNNTLRNVFDDFNELENFDFSDGFNNWTSNSVTNINVSNGYLTYSPSSRFPRIIQNNLLLSPNDTYFALVSRKINDYTKNNVSELFLHNGSSAEYFVSANVINDNDWYYEYGRVQNTNNNNAFWIYNTLSSDWDNSVVLFALQDVILINLTYLNIENLADTEIAYWYNVYYALKRNINIDWFYNDGNNDGYDSGYDSGYDAGLIVGYDNGLVDGLETGYNNGVDYAVQNNISILSIFELIFGVALNMITFIITIDIFGISILSIISVLSLMVGAVWILKMVRG